MKLNLYLLYQNDNSGYDTFDSCVVVAKSENDARKIHPYGDVYGVNDEKYSVIKYNAWNESYSWSKIPENVKVTYLGVADKSRKENEVICASFNAG